MKTDKIIGLLVWLAIGCIFQSCSDITDMQREYLDRGETLYVGRIDSIQFRGGLHRVQMEGLLKYARSASCCVVSWNDQSLEYAINEISNKDMAKVLIENLEEGTYRFFIQTFDEEGNKSIKSECYGYVYGDEYIMSQSPKFITEIVPDPKSSKVTLSWNAVDNAEQVLLLYENSSGKMVRQLLPGDVRATEIDDWKKGGKIECTTYTLPEENALDTIPLTPYIQYFPENVEYEMDKSLFAIMPLPTDTKGNEYGENLLNLWNGVKGGGCYCSMDGEGVPHHFTFDLGVNAHLTKVELVGRFDFTGWNPKHFQIWGINSLEGAETTLDSADPDWEKEAKEKGWQLLVEEDTKDPITNVYKLTKPVNGDIRYIRYRITEVNGYNGFTTGKNVFGQLSEITFWADEIKYMENK